MILVYSETPEAVELVEKYRAEGAKAFLRNPEFFSESEMESADKVVCHVADSHIVAAYVSKGVGYNWLDNAQAEEVQNEAETKTETENQKVSPIKKRGK